MNKATVYQLGVEQGSVDVLKPYRIHEAENRTSSFSRRPIVLARLLFVGQHDCQSSEYPPEQDHHTNSMPTMPSSATPTPEQLHQRPAYEENIQRRQTDKANVAAQHLQAHSYIADDQIASATNYPRVDSGHHASDRQHQTEQQSSNQQPTWSRAAENPNGLFQLQKQLATNSGLIVTLALIASAVFLYMAIIAPVEPPTVDYSNSYEFYGMNPAEPSTSLAESESSSEAQVKSLNLPADPFEVDATESGQDSLVLGNGSPIGGAFDHSNERVAAAPGEGLLLEPTHSKPNRRPEVVQLPTIDEESNVDVELIFDDASAFVYPNTHQPIFDFGPLNITDETTDSTNSKSAVANRPQFN